MHLSFASGLWDYEVKSLLSGKKGNALPPRLKPTLSWAERLFLRFFVWVSAGIGMGYDFFLLNCSTDAEAK